MSIIVTGATGFLGKKLISKLIDKNYRVIAVVRRKKLIPKNILNNSNITWIKCNLEKDVIKLPDKIKIKAAFHLAGATSGKNLSKKDYFKKNELTTINFLKSIQKKTKRIIHISSQVVYGNPNKLNIIEEHPITDFPLPYAMSKINSETHIKDSQKKFNNMSIILRLSGFIEGGGNIDYIINQALKNREILLYSNGNVYRDYLPVDNAIEVFIKCIKVKYTSKSLILNLSSGKALASLKVANVICNILNSKSIIKLSNKKAQIENFSLNVEKSKNIFNMKPINMIYEIKKYSISKKNL